MTLTLARHLLATVTILLLVLQPAHAGELFYLGEKIPDVHRPWVSQDYLALRQALERVEQHQLNALPRRSGEFTGPIYQRMVAEDNFRPQLNIYAPLELRQNEARETLFQLKELMRLYFDFRAKQQPYAAEALGLMSYSLRQQAILFNLTTEFWGTLSEAEQRSAIRLQGLQETKDAAAMLTSSALDYLNLTDAFGREELQLYSAELSRQLPGLFIHLPPTVQQQLLKRIGELAQQHRYPSIGQNMASLAPVLAMITEDVVKKEAQPLKAKAPKTTLDLSLPSSVQ